MGSVRRVFVEKKPDYAVAAKELRHEIRRYLGIMDVTGVRVLIRYDVENISDDTFEKACSEPGAGRIFRRNRGGPLAGRLRSHVRFYSPVSPGKRKNHRVCLGALAYPLCRQISGPLSCPDRHDPGGIPPDLKFLSLSRQLWQFCFFYGMMLWLTGSASCSGGRSQYTKELRYFP